MLNLIKPQRLILLLSLSALLIACNEGEPITPTLPVDVTKEVMQVTKPIITEVVEELEPTVKSESTAVETMVPEIVDVTKEVMQVTKPIITEVVEELEPMVKSESTAVETMVPEIVDVDETGATDIDLEMLDTLLTQSTATLNAEEIAGLLFMREEEKLARDVYLNLFELWGQRTFENIARSEQTHMDAVLRVLSQYDLADSASAEIGQFNNPDLQQLYTDLMAQGSQSMVAALQVGATIEEIDIIDLAEWSSQTNNSDIILLYENLAKGSRNHLRAFVSVIERQSGEIYLPQYLTTDHYEQIVHSATEQNGRGIGNGNGNH